MRGSEAPVADFSLLMHDRERSEIVMSGGQLTYMRTPTLNRTGKTAMSLIAYGLPGSADTVMFANALYYSSGSEVLQDAGQDM